MKTIPLTQGKVALVDEADYSELSKHKWYTHRYANERYCYAKRHWKVVDGKQVIITMHRFLMDFPEDKVVDHIDGNGLNNQRSNLRVVTTRENILNSHPPTRTKSGYRGVSWEAKMKRWRVRIHDGNGRKLHVGWFTDVKKAAEAYNIAALQYYGKFASTKLNLI